jgi:hypothetical protein
LRTPPRGCSQNIFLLYCFPFKRRELWQECFYEMRIGNA